MDRFAYGYDRNSNVLYKNNLGPGSNAASFSELYHANGRSSTGTGYDNFDRLTGLSRGTLPSRGNPNLGMIRSYHA